MVRLQLEDLTFAYPGGGDFALKGVSLRLEPGMFGLLGPNGAGKTTLMKLACGLLESKTGEIRLDGEALAPDRTDLRRRVSMMPQDFGLFAGLDVQACLHYMGTLHGFTKTDVQRRAQQWIDTLELGRLLQRRSDQLSGGERQKVGLAMALLPEPDVLLVDEPTAGLDPLERDRVLRTLHAYAEGACVLLSTHIVEDVLECCPAAAVLIDGTIAAADSTTALATHLEGRLWTRALERASDADDERVVLRAGQPLQWRVSDDAPGPVWTAAAGSLRSTFVYLIDRSRHRDVA
ncbi:MAG: ATP-binding cassette domain-containing protein [Nannocystaceae bacterium]|nr:ATP-binding cassette domain-containing protein [Nannocystaceae bacterium]